METPVFTRRLPALLSDEEYRLLQLFLIAGPDRGPLIRDGAGLRKIRWGRRASGKRGGVRVIYYWAKREATVHLLFAYSKVDQGELSMQQVRTLARHVREELR